MATTQVFRLQKIIHNPTTLTGIGAQKTGGRFNAEGTPLIYTSSSSSLSVLEMGAHLGSLPKDRFPPLNMAVIELPEEFIHVFDPKDLPVGWDSIPALDCAQQFLAPYLKPGNQLAFSVPSVINPYERNVLINPLHPDIKKVCRVVRFDPYTIDKRLFYQLID